MAQKKLKRIKKVQRLRVPLVIQIPDLDLYASYKTPNRRMRIWVDGEYKGIYKSMQTLFLPKVRLRSVITVEKVFISDSGDEIDFTQKYIVGQNFIEGYFNSGKVRRKNVDFEEDNVLKLIQQQDFWD